MDDPLVLHKYDPNWPNRFLEEEQAITDLLGEEVIAIHHVGSTSVPGLLAKSIVDIALEIRQYPPSQALIEALASIGYEHMGESGVRGRNGSEKDALVRFIFTLFLRMVKLPERRSSYVTSFVNTQKQRRNMRISRN